MMLAWSGTACNARSVQFLITATFNFNLHALHDVRHSGIDFHRIHDLACCPDVESVQSRPATLENSVECMSSCNSNFGSHVAHGFLVDGLKGQILDEVTFVDFVVRELLIKVLQCVGINTVIIRLGEQ